MTNYRIAHIDEEQEILDFSNMVFAMAAGPIDFRLVYPAIYGREGFSKLHIIARNEEDRLVSSIAVKPMMLKLGEGEALSLGYLGTVATHPMERGKGYMKQLMRMSIDRAREAGLDMVVLGGQRQRYNHYDFEKCATVLSFQLYAENLRELPHEEEFEFMELSQADDATKDMVYAAFETLVMTAERKREAFEEIMRTSQGRAYVFFSNGQVRGYVYSHQGNIFEHSFIGVPAVGQLARCWLKHHAPEGFSFEVALHEKDAMAQLAAVAESWQMHDHTMVHVLNWASSLQKLMSFKAKYEPLSDGEVSVEVKGQAKLRLSVSHGIPKVEAVSNDENCPVVLSPNQAVLRFFSYVGQMQEAEDQFFGWFPLMLSIPKPDWF